MAVGLLGVPGPGPAGADVPQAFRLQAAASATRTTVVAPGAPVSESVVDVGSVAAQGSLSSVGDQVAFAAAPYPGATVVDAPALLRSQGVPAELEYPAIATADALHPEAHRTLGPYELHATSSDRRVGATASVADSPTEGTAHVSVGFEPDGTSVASARTSIGSIDIGALKVRSLRSHAIVRVGPEGRVAKDHAFDVGSISLAGTLLRVREGRVSVVGVPGDAGVEAARAVMAAAGIQLEVVPGHDDDSGASSGGLRVRTVQHPPAVVATATVTTVLGESVAFAESDVGTPTVTTIAPASTPGSSPRVGEPVPPRAPTLPSANDPPSPAVVGPPAAIASPVVSYVDVGSFYVVLLAAGVALVVGPTLVRLLGVRNAWNSSIS